MTSEDKLEPTLEPEVDALGSEGGEEAKREDSEVLRERLEAAEALAEERLDDLRRVAADFDNYRKRAARDQENTVLRAAERVVRELLPVVDDLDRTLDAAQGSPSIEGLVAGVEMVKRNLTALLEREGVREIDASGQFDPHLHEALAAMPAPVPEGAVLEVVQKGYTIAERVIRPARVVIAAPPAGDGESGSGGEVGSNGEEGEGGQGGQGADAGEGREE